jgi:hypothetical protein
MESIMIPDKALPDFPEKKLHIFNDVSFELLPEISYEDLVYLSQLIEQTGRKALYSPLIDCLRKIQWAKLAGLEAIIIEKRISEQATLDAIPFDPVGQVQHMKALFDFVAHSKAALDSLAVFFNDLFNLGQEGGNRDFRRPLFYRKVCEADVVIAQHLAGLKAWLDKNRDVSDSLVATRDEWQHRGSPAIQSMFPIPAIGYLPVPRALKGGFPNPKTPLTNDYYWTTPEFVKFHMQKLTSLFAGVIARCIELEKAQGARSVRLDPALVRHPMSFLPMRGTAETKPKQMRVRPFTPIFLDSNSLFEELPHKVLKTLTQEEADLFAKLAKYRTFGMHDKQHSFVAVTDDLLNGVLKISKGQVELLEEIGLVTKRHLALTKGTTFVCGDRGFRVSWPDKQTRDILVYLLTRVGTELASLVRINCDDSYINSFISILNTCKVNVRLIAVSDLNDTSFKYDDLGEFKYESTTEESGHL